MKLAILAAAFLAASCASPANAQPAKPPCSAGKPAQQAECLRKLVGDMDVRLKRLEALLSSGFHIRNVSSDRSCIQPTGRNAPLIGAECHPQTDQQRWELTPPNVGRAKLPRRR